MLNVKISQQELVYQNLLSLILFSKTMLKDSSKL